MNTSSNLQTFSFHFNKTSTNRIAILTVRMTRKNPLLRACLGRSSDQGRQLELRHPDFWRTCTITNCYNNNTT